MPLSPSHQVLQLDPQPGNGRNSEGAFLSLLDGTLVFAWSQFEVAHDHARSRIVCRTSPDGGLTWRDDKRVLVDPEGAVNVMSTSLLRLQDGRILLSYLRKEADVHGTLRCIPYVCYSADELGSFSPPIAVTLAPGYFGTNNDRIVQLSSGRLIVPVAAHRFRMPSTAIPDWPNNPIISNPAIITFFFSDDGTTWYESLNNCYVCSPNGRGLQEPGVVELKDGRLWAFMRTNWEIEEGQGSRQWQTFSADGGETWSTAEPSGFYSPNSPMSVKRIPGTGDLLAVWNDHSGHFAVPQPTKASKGRTPLVCAISSDEGHSWTHHSLLEDAPDHGFCYTAIHFEDDAVLLAYCAGSMESGGVLTRLRMVRIPIAKLYATN